MMRNNIRLELERGGKIDDLEAKSGDENYERERNEEKNSFTRSRHTERTISTISK